MKKNTLLEVLRGNEIDLNESLKNASKNIKSIFRNKNKLLFRSVNYDGVSVTKLYPDIEKKS